MYACSPIPSGIFKGQIKGITSPSLLNSMKYNTKFCQNYYGTRAAGVWIDLLTVVVRKLVRLATGPNQCLFLLRPMTTFVSYSSRFIFPWTQRYSLTPFCVAPKGWSNISTETEVNGHIECRWNSETGVWSEPEFIKDPFLRVHGLAPVFHYGLCRAITPPGRTLTDLRKIGQEAFEGLKGSLFFLHRLLPLTDFVSLSSPKRGNQSL